jgi:hypothetical protein
MYRTSPEASSGRTTGITHDGDYRSEAHSAEQAIFGEKRCLFHRTHNRQPGLDRFGRDVSDGPHNHPALATLSNPGPEP